MEEEIEEVDELVINPTFEPFFQDNLTDKRYYQVYGGRGSGKSFGVALGMVLKTYSKYKHKILFLRQTMSSSEDSTISDVRSAIETLRLRHDFVERNGVIVNKVTGATISFKGIRSSGTQTAKLKSLSGITTLVVEEAEEVESFEEFSKVDESIRIKGKPLKVILVYNPTSSVSSWIHKEWFVEGVPMLDRLEDTEYLHSTYLDNLDNLNESVVKRYKDLETKNPTYYKNVILAEWTLETQGRIYDGWDRIDSLGEIKGEEWYGLDFGYGGSDKTSLIKITYYDKTYYVQEIFSVAKLKIGEMIQKLKKANISKFAKIYADSAMPLLIDEIRDKGYNGIRKAQKGNVEQGIKRVQDKKIVVVGSKETGLYFGYQTFCRDKNDKLPHEPDELAALRYGVNSHKPIEPVNRNAIRTHRQKGFV